MKRIYRLSVLSGLLAVIVSGWIGAAGVGAATGVYGFSKVENGSASPTLKPVASTLAPVHNDNASRNKGSLSDPVELGTSFTYHDRFHYKDNDEMSADYTYTIKKAVSVSNAEISALGLKLHNSDPVKSYMMLTVHFKVNNATLVKGTGKDATGYTWLHAFEPEVWASITTEDDLMKGAIDSGFAGSVYRNMRALFKNGMPPKVTPGQSQSYEVTGNLLLPVSKNKTNFLMLIKSDHELKYEDKFIYFKLS